jgi:antitoxin HicB
MFPYRIVTEWSAEDGAYVARVPALPNCAAHGDTAAQAAEEAEVAASAMIEVLGAKAPASDTEQPSGKIMLRLPRSLHADLARLAAMEDVSLNQLMVSLLSARAASLVSVSKPKRAPEPVPRRSAAKHGASRKPARSLEKA